MARRHGGASVSDHYASVARQTGRAAPKPPPLPPAARHLWDTWAELHRRRHPGMGGPLPIAHSEIEALTRLKRWPLAPWEVDAIVALDDAYLASEPDTAGTK